MTCYHIWHLSQTANAFFRWKRCYAKKQTADAAVRRWKSQSPDLGGHRPAPGTGVYMVRQCDGDPCPCLCRRV